MGGKRFKRYGSGLVENFKEWACSFSGCDGGDLESSVWLCGIEWGYSNPDGLTDEEYQEDMRIEALYRNNLDNSKTRST